MFNSGTAFSYDLLKYMDSVISIGAVPFERAASIYNYNIDNGKKVMNDDRLEIAWYIFRILEYVGSFKVWPRKKKVES